jgi:hypothetical protein
MTMYRAVSIFACNAAALWVLVVAAAIEPSTAASPLECRELSQQYAAA